MMMMMVIMTQKLLNFIFLEGMAASSRPGVPNLWDPDCYLLSNQQWY